MSDPPERVMEDEELLDTRGRNITLGPYAVIGDGWAWRRNQ